jgi:glycosyltransferase involved in cell wall biosynthesis
MNILIAYQYLSFKGGLEHVIEVQANHLRKAGHTVTVVTSQYLPNEPNELADGIPIRRLTCLNLFYTKFGIPFALPYPSLRNGKLLYSLVGSADLVNVHGHPYWFSFVVTVFARLRRKPIVLTQHNTEITATSRLVNAIYKLVDRSIGRFNISKASAVVAVSDATRNYVVGLAPNQARKVVTVYNGIDAETYKPSDNKDALRRALDLPADTFVCFTVRRITFKNGIDILLEAAQLARNAHVLFLLGGSGPDLERVRKYVNDNGLDNVKLLGFISDEDLPKYYAAADAFILPSRQGEGFPMVVLEAFASGLPVIATTSGGHVEIIEDGVTGFLVDVERPEQIDAKIRELMHRDLDVIARRCRELVLRDFTWQANMSGLMRVIEGVEVDAA